MDQQAPPRLVFSGMRIGGNCIGYIYAYPTTRIFNPSNGTSRMLVFNELVSFIHWVYIR